jgi:hypothetical protein
MITICLPNFRDVNPLLRQQLFNPTKAEPELMGGLDEVTAKVGGKPYHE